MTPLPLLSLNFKIKKYINYCFFLFSLFNNKKSPDQNHPLAPLPPLPSVFMPSELRLQNRSLYSYIQIEIDRQIGTHIQNAKTHTKAPFNLLLYQINDRWIDRHIDIQIHRYREIDQIEIARQIDIYNKKYIYVRMYKNFSSL